MENQKSAPVHAEAPGGHQTENTKQQGDATPAPPTKAPSRHQNEDKKRREDTARESPRETALKAPPLPGVYLWRNAARRVIYVGKAKNLHARLSSYFSGRHDTKTSLLVRASRSIEYITTANEYEAFLLENNLIKRWTPRYNIDLKDGKSYPVIRITAEKFPRVIKTRNRVQDGSLYFGPYPDSGALDTFIDTIYALWPLRHCKRFRKKTYPCVYYHMGRCLAPCCKKVDEKTYSAFIEEIKTLLKSKSTGAARAVLEEKMKSASSSLNFELAARLRNLLDSLDIIQNTNTVETFNKEDRDYIASARDGETVCFTVLKIRGGCLLARDSYTTRSLSEDDDLISEFMASYYTSPEIIPPKIFTSEQNERALMIRWMQETYGLTTEIISGQDLSSTPNAAENDALHKASLEMAAQNAREDVTRALRLQGDKDAMRELKEVLHLSVLPRRIEGFDIAHIGGRFPVASLVSFLDGNPDKKNYRFFRLKTTDGIIDDFASMREATARRYTRLLNEKRELPDLILIDGGIGQVNAVEGVLASLGLDVRVIGLAKRDEEIWLPHASSPIKLPRRSDALRLLQRVRDETHRFATSKNQALRTKENTVSPFTALPYVGERRAALLTKAFVTLDALGKAGAPEVAELLKVSPARAEEIIKEAGTIAKERQARQAKDEQALSAAGTTKERAAHTQGMQALAARALEVASPEG